MEFALNDIDVGLAAAMRALGQRVSHRVTELDAAGSFPHDAWKELAAAGLTGLPIPKRYGGQGACAISTVAALVGLGETCTDNGLLFALGAHLWACADPIARHGSELQKQRWLRGLCDGSLIGAHAATEAEAGSDAAGIRTTAEQTADGWVLRGRKAFVTNAPIADVFLVTARTSRDRGAMGISAFLVARESHGVDVGPPIGKSGLRTAPMAEVMLDDCVVGHDAILGTPGAGMAVFTNTMTRERGFILAPAVGTLRRLAEQSYAYTRQRRQFGQPILDFDSVANRVADMRIRAETARLLTLQYAWLIDQQRAQPHDAAMVKLHLSESLLASSLDAVQVRGAYGYATDLGLERMVRDALGARIYSGTSDIQRNLIARARMRSDP